MERRFVLFVVLSFAILLGYSALMSRLNPPPKIPPRLPKVADRRAAGKEGPGPKEEPGKPPGVVKPGEGPEEPAEGPGEAPQPVAKQPAIPRQWVSLGSADPTDSYRMWVTLSNKGAAVERIELNGPRYHELDVRSGYLGSVVMDAALFDATSRGKGCPVQIVGPGTPAAKAGLKVGDLIVALDETPITSFKQFRAAMAKTKPKREVKLTVLRGGKKLGLTAKLRRNPLQLIRPEGTDPRSFLLTLDRIGHETLEDQRKRDVCIWRIANDLGVHESDVSALDISNLDREAGRLQVPAKGENAERWAHLTDAIMDAVMAWLSVRGNEAGPLFYSVSIEGTRHRLSPERIDAILYQFRDEARQQRAPELFLELDGVELRTGNWKVVKAGIDEAAFRRVLPKWGLEITKTYRLAKVPREKAGNRDCKAYHLLLDVKIRNISGETRKVAYQLDGPTGLPVEGVWYANKVSRTWSAAGLRDVVASFDHAVPITVNCPKIAKGKLDPPWRDQSLTFIGVDAQYFSAMMIPQKEDPAEIWLAQSQPLRVGPVNEKLLKTTNTSCRMISQSQELAPDAQLTHRYMIFAGPKAKKLLAHYGLGELIYYGWQWYAWLAVGLSHILHVVYAVVHNYGVAIILLTILVRGCMFPLSFKQAAGMQKMQQLQPEIKKIQEKYKNDMEGRGKAQQELFRKHNYNPLSGCLVLFIQLPIFIALYRSLIVDIELRQAPLIAQSVRWCSNLAAPDMLYHWTWMPDMIKGGVGLLGLGPYLNILPILTIGLFIAQQKMFMPPPTDEQTAIQQKMMKFMMIFMGFIFFKVASGLCIYFIASSLWGLAERQFLPKHKPAKSGEKIESRADAKAKVRAQAAAETKAKARQPAAGRDGAAARRKKKTRQKR